MGDGITDLMDMGLSISEIFLYSKAQRVEDEFHSTPARVPGLSLRHPPPPQHAQDPLLSTTLQIGLSEV